MRWVTSFLSVTIAALLLYITTAAPSIVTFFDDTLEFQFIAPTFSIAHPTGYPLYTLLGGLWSRLIFPFGNWAWRMNLFSALTASLAIGIFFVFSRKFTVDSYGAQSDGLSQINADNQLNGTDGLTTDQWYNLTILCAGIGAIVLALTPTWWQIATVAEVYALHGLFVVVILYMTISISPVSVPLGSSAPIPPASLPTALSDITDKQLFRKIFWLAFLIGLSLTHHRLTLLLLPGIGLYLARMVPSILRPQVAWIAWFFGLMAPLLLYLYIPMRSGMGAVDLNGSYQNTVAGFFTHVNATAYTTFLSWNSQALVEFRTQFSWWGLLWGIVGGIFVPLSYIWRRSPTGKLQPEQLHDNPTLMHTSVRVDDKHRYLARWMLIWVTFVISLLFGLFYNVDDVTVFLIPAYICWALFMGQGLWGFIVQVEQAKTRPYGERGTRTKILPFWAYAVVALFIAMSPLLYNDMVNRSQDWQAHDRAIALAKMDFPSESRIIGLEGEATAIKYMQQSEGLAKGAIPLWANLPEQRLDLVESLMQQNVPLFLTQEVVGIESQYSFSGHGRLIRVWPRGTVPRQEPQQHMAMLFVEDALSLDGVDLYILDEAGGPKLQIVYYWRPNQPISQRIKLSLRLLDQSNVVLDGNGQAITDDQFPLRQVTYTEYWVPGEQIRDVHYLALPQSQSTLRSRILGQKQSQTEKVYELLTILYDTSTIEELGRVSISVPPFE